MTISTMESMEVLDFVQEKSKKSGHDLSFEDME